MKKTPILWLASRLLTLALLLVVATESAQAQDKPVVQGPAAGTTIVHPRDGAVMVYVPAGVFTMGISPDEADALAKSFGYKDYRAIAAEEWFPKRQEYVD